MTNENLENNLEGRKMSMMFLLFDKPCEMPSNEEIAKKLSEKGYQVDAQWEANNQSLRIFYLPEYTVDFSDAKNVPFQLMMFDIVQREKPLCDEITKTQFWRTPNSEDLINSCQWQVMISDFMSINHPPKIRTKILSDWLYIALELFPTCKAVWFEGSRNILDVETLNNNPLSEENRVLYGGMNARFFRIGTSDDFIVDTLGLHTFGVPDVQIHFHSLNPNDVVNLAYDIAFYQFENDVPITDGETVAGLDEKGIMNENIQWKCQYEVSIIDPKREVLDINPENYAAGNR